MKTPYTGFIFTMLIIITVIIIFNTALGKEVKTKSQWLNENPCMIKVLIKEKTKCFDSECLISETIVEKEEIQGQEDSRQNTGHHEESVTPAQLQDDELHEHTVNETKATPHLPYPHHHPAPL